MHPRLVTLVALALLASGCLGATDTSTPPAPDLPAPAGALAFLDPVLLGNFRGSAEPNVAVSASGIVYVTSVSGPNLWRSDDGGTTYTWLGTPRACPGGAVPDCPLGGRDAGLRGAGDGDIAVTPDGRVHWLGLNAQDAPIPYQVSDDLGVTWSDPADLAEGNNSDREWINARPSDGALFATWRDFGKVTQQGNDPLGLTETTEGKPGILVRVSKDGGATWSSASRVADDTRQGGAVPDPNGGAVYLPYDVSGEIKVARSLDDAHTWENVTAAKLGTQRGHIFPVAAVDGAGTVYVVFAVDKTKPTAAPEIFPVTDRGLERPSVYLIRSADRGTTWTEPTRLNPEGTTAMFPWIAAGAKGRIAVAWYENVQGTSLQEAGEWWTTVGVSTDAEAENPTWLTSRVGARPAHVGPICTNGAACTFTAGDRTLLDFFEIAIHPQGYPVLAWAADADVRRATINVYATRMTDGPNLLAS